MTAGRALEEVAERPLRDGLRFKRRIPDFHALRGTKDTTQFAWRAIHFARELGMKPAGMREVDGHDIVAIGASAGGLEALKRLIQQLPEGLPAALFVVLHLPKGHAERIPAILTNQGQYSAKLAANGDRVQHGQILVAPPDRHLIVKEGEVRLSNGPRENFWRPSIDVLFRSAAVAYGPRTVGVVLSGALDDGSAGLSAIVRCGGVALVQDPDEAVFIGMPESATRNVPQARVLPVKEIAAALAQLAVEAPSTAPPIPADLRLEVRIAEGDDAAAAESETVGNPSPNTCVECGGPLRIQADDTIRFRCHVGHAYSASSLLEGTRQRIENSLWSAVRLFQQRSNLTRAMATREREKGRVRGAKSYEERAAESESHADALRELLMRLAD